jgi:hypothetical protein
VGDRGGGAAHRVVVSVAVGGGFRRACSQPARRRSRDYGHVRPTWVHVAVY